MAAAQLDEFITANGSISRMEAAYDNALMAFYQCSSLDMRLRAATIAIAAFYVFKSKVRSDRVLGLRPTALTCINLH